MEHQVQGVIQRDTAPPPPYSMKEEDGPAQCKLQIRRKPVGTTNNPIRNNGDNGLVNGTGRTFQAENLEKEQTLATSPQAPVDVSSQEERPALPPRPPVIRDAGPVASPQSTSNGSAPTNGMPAETDSETVGWKKTASEHAQKAFQEARHFVGGLIAHPSVSNKHYTILRHSHGVVFYQGSNTSLAISIFVDEPLPKDRTIWMQCKGFSGKTGMRAKAFLGLNDSWINVTPTLAIRPDQVNPSDERAWQRDIQRFRKKASSGGSLDRHILRETAIVRIPVEATDGYYQLVLCRGDQKRKPLCTSPVFRVISTSSDPSTLRGASLSTLPIELGLWVGGLYAQSTASTVVSPVTTKIQDSSLMPSGTTQLAAQTAYTVSGLEDRVDSRVEEAGDHYSKTQTEIYTRLGPVDTSAGTGPTPPYPVDFVATLNLQATISTFDSNGYPKKISVVGIPQNILPRLDGHYFAWCKVLPVDPKTDQKPSSVVNKKSNETPSQSWLQCIISASSIVFQEQMSNVRSRKALKVTTSIKFLDDIDIPPMARVQVRIMGFIRPPKAATSTTTTTTTTTSASIQSGNSEAAAENEEQIMLDICDIELTRNTLDNPAWQADSMQVFGTGALSNTQRSIDGGGPEKEQAAQSGVWDKAKDGYSNMRLKGQTMVGQIPFHRAGIRTGTDGLRDKNLAIGGYYIPR